jgi:hypothetical protein
MPHTPAGLPIVIGLQSAGEITDPDSWGLRKFLEAEFRARCECYPQTPVVLHIRAESAIREIGRAAAAACAIPVLETPRGVLALFCHLLIDVALVANADSDNSDPVAMPSDAEMPEGDLIEFDAETKGEVIHLQLLAGSKQVRLKFSRYGVDEATHHQLVHPSPANRLMMRTNRFNVDAIKEAAVHEVSPGAELSIDALYARADALALTFQHKVHLTFRVIFSLASVAALFYGCFLTVAGSSVVWQNRLLVGYVVLIAISYGIYLYARRRDIHPRFVEYRTLAEGLRVQHYWQACGVAQSVAACYLIRQPLEYHWIRLALWHVSAANPPPHPPSDSEAPAAPLALQGWIDDQEQYFALTQARSHRLESHLRYVVAGIFIAGVGASLLIMVAQHVTVLKPIELRISLVSALCPSLSAAIVALVTKLGLLYQASHYGRMQAVFDQARRRLRRHPTGATTRIAVALGEEALQENESWAQFRRERGIDEPASPFRRPW